MSFGGTMQSSRNHFREPPSMVTRTFNEVRAALHRLNIKPRDNWTVSRIFSFLPLLTIIWLYVVYVSERSVFRKQLDQCRWEQWEAWPAHANPHHLVFVADPQLVDPHTYPGRPWPLSTLTVKYTDLYLRRSYSLIQKTLYPDTIFFLGDLFDGGREWSTRFSKSEDAQWRKYGQNFWLREYGRFGNIFFKHWGDAGMNPRVGQPGKKIISSLPGNHDLGFSTGIQTQVRKRFNAYFGEGNRVDVIGNHTFVSIDAVSLSARDSPAESSEEIWKPTQAFLDEVKSQKKRAVTQDLRKQRGINPNPLYKHSLVETEDLPQDLLPGFEEAVTEFPTILLTHVPLFRAPGTPCGPKREHWPPSPPPKGQTEPLENDERNAIAVRGGYQYQNVLSEEVSKDVTEKIGDISYAFSGDDHDYCEVVHRRYPSAGSGIREITVKSLSWAMGVRHPGFVMLSMWNPVDEQGNPIEKSSASGSSIQSHLCLMPDQLSLFIRYAMLFLVTILVLGVRGLLISSGTMASTVNAAVESPLLPMSENASSAENEKAVLEHSRSGSDEENYSTRASTRSVQNIQNGHARTRTASPAGGYGLPTGGQQQTRFKTPLIQHAGYFGPAEGAYQVPVWPKKKDIPKPRAKKLKGAALAWAEFKWSIIRVASVVLCFYFWLIWRG